MSAHAGPITGSNTNIERSGRTYHVQTEDSGAGHPHVITHLFADGGRIVATRRTEYTSWVPDPACAELVRFLIRFQHKAMIKAVGEGRYDAELVSTSDHPPAPREEPPFELTSLRATYAKVKERLAAQPSLIEPAHDVAPPAPPPAPKPARASAAARPRDVSRVTPPLGVPASNDLNTLILEYLAGY